VKRIRVVIAGGGTGGHLYPGVAVARELLRRQPDAQVTFAGTARGLEATLVPKEGFELDVIRSAGLKGRSIAAVMRGLALVPVSFADAWALLARRRPNIVIGLGGYSSGPVVMMAALRRIPTMLLEQNSVPGLTNRRLARVVRAAALTYDDVNNYFGRKAFVTGNPVRPEFFTQVTQAHSSVPNDRRRILVLGGSQGSHALNVACVAASPELVRRHPGIEVVHQTGQRELAAVREGYERAGVGARAESFLDGVAGEIAAADLVICRAGATTLAELAAVGRPAVLVPLPTATDDHQRKNAEVLVRAGAAVMVEQQSLNSETLAGVVSALLNDSDRRARMGAAMKTLARPDAAARIVDRVLELAAA
jgi:UDP-N-acetylglucosamine--N-acetylmuramyl-(pentapeptide) pyrophosphoryl-undecaprenol N-acetylglucosamine transferase